MAFWNRSRIAVVRAFPAVLVASLTLAGCSEFEPGTPPGSGVPPTPGTSWGAAIRPLQIRVGNYVFDARAAGPADGELVLLLHGFPQTSLEWQSQLHALARAGYRAVAPDQRGYSPGARPPDVASYTINAIALDTLGMVDALGYDRFHLVGHDWGAVVAWTVAAIVPRSVQTLTALSWPHPSAFAAALADEQSCQYQASAYFDAFTGAGPPPFEPTQVTNEVPLTSLLEYFLKVIGNPPALDAALNWYRANVAGRRMGSTVTYGSISVPTLFIWGTNDVAFCRDTAEASARYVTGPYRFVALEDAGHWLPESHAAQVTDALLRHVSR